MKKVINRISALFLVAILAVGCAANKSFHIPAGKGDLETIKAELEGGRDIDSRDAAGQTALMYAAENGQMDVVRYLISNGADVNAQAKDFFLRGTALIYATSSNRLDVIEYLIENGADVNATTKNKETALFYAAARGYKKAVEILLKNGADTELKNKKDQTALDLARELNRTEIVELLLNQ